MNLNAIFIVCICYLALLCGACSVEPALELSTAEGKRCVAQCRSAQNSCENFHKFSNSDQQQCDDQAENDYRLCEIGADSEYTQCQMQSQSDYIACINNVSDSGACTQAICIKKTCIKQVCAQAALVSFCDTEYQNCYQQCVSIEKSTTHGK